MTPSSSSQRSETKYADGRDFLADRRTAEEV